MGYPNETGLEQPQEQDAMTRKKQTSPRDYQEEAIKSVVGELKKNNKASLSMACGTGKTLVGLWIAERLKAKRTIIFLPSLALIKQTIETWRANTKLYSKNIYSICSLTKMYDDISASELNSEALSSRKEIKEKLSKKPNDYEAIFCTYQSSINIPKSIEFSLAIFDEAHKTAHKNHDGSFRYPIYDKNVLINKRLFMTATPKVFISEDCEDSASYSMDNQNIYGKTVFSLGFEEALKRKIVCDYKIIITTVSSEEINQSIDPKKQIAGSKLETKALALSLAKAYKRIAASRSISFHRTIKDAQAFSDEFKNIKDTSTASLHINGKMSNKQRASCLKSFKSGTRSNISCARFLSEGVDIPTVDLVSFMSPKKSKVDIIQAVGRVMRNAPGKEFGYILLPVFIKKSDINNINNQFLSSEYSYIWKILRALSFYDKTLKNETTERITSSEDQKNSRKKIVIMSDTNINSDLCDAIDLHIVNNIFHDEWIETFEKYKNSILNKCKDVPKKEAKHLLKWARHQRWAYKNKTLSNEKQKQLESVNFNFNPIESTWNENLDKLKDVIASGNIAELTSCKTSVSLWLYTQRRKNTNGQLSKDKFKNIMSVLKKAGKEELLSTLNSIDKSRAEKLDRLKSYYKKHGHCNISYKDDKNLYKWTHKIRAQKLKISDKDKLILNSMKFNWSYNKKVDTWKDNYQKLVNYYKKYKTFSFSSERAKENLSLSRWCVRQRARFKKNKLTKDERTLLKNIKFLS